MIFFLKIYCNIIKMYIFNLFACFRLKCPCLDEAGNTKRRHVMWFFKNATGT